MSELKHLADELDHAVRWLVEAEKNAQASAALDRYVGQKPNVETLRWQEVRVEAIRNVASAYRRWITERSRIEHERQHREARQRGEFRRGPNAKLLPQPLSACWREKTTLQRQ